MAQRTQTALRDLQRDWRKKQRAETDEAPLPEHWRPKTRLDCQVGPRPCPYYGCRYHLGLEVTYSGSLKFPFGERLEDMPETCALDVAEQGGLDLTRLAEHLNYNKERARQLLLLALKSLQDRLASDEDLAETRRQSASGTRAYNAIFDEAK